MLHMTAERVHDIARARSEAGGKMLAAARRISTAYDGDLVFPVPQGTVGGAVANLIRQGIDGVGMRVADPPESVEVPPLKSTKAAATKAEAQRRALLGLLEQSDHDLVKRQRARHLVGMGRAPVLVAPDFHENTVVWEPLSPLSVLPGAAVRRGGGMVLHDAVIVTTCTWGWLCDRYEEQAKVLWRGGRECSDSDLFRLLRWESAEECLLAVAGRADHPWETAQTLPSGMSAAVTLHHYANPAGVCPVVVPQIVTMTDSARPVYEQMVGMYEQRAELNALSVQAVKRGVFQDEWVVARQNETPEVVAVPDPASGTIGVIRGGDLVGRPVDPQFMQNQQGDRLEYGERQTGGIPSEMGGAASSNVRTGRRGGQVMSAAVDFPVAEAQNLLARSLGKELEIAAKVDKAWFPDVDRVWAVGWKGAKGQVSYKPREMWATEPRVKVSHAAPGADQADLVIAGGQRVGMGTMARESFMALDPLVKDVEEEKDRLLDQGLLDAWWSSVQAMASNPEGPLQPADYARLARLIREEDKDPYEAMEQVQREAQERQAAQVPAGDPALMPGMSMPGQGMEAGGGVPAIPDPTQSMPSTGNLNQLLMGLRGPTMASPLEGASR